MGETAHQHCWHGIAKKEYTIPERKAIIEALEATEVL